MKVYCLVVSGKYHLINESDYDKCNNIAEVIASKLLNFDTLDQAFGTVKSVLHLGPIGCSTYV